MAEVDDATSLPDGDDVRRRLVVGEHLAQRAVPVDDQVGVAADGEPVPVDAEDVGGRGGDGVVHEVDAGGVDGLERVRGEERDLEHVVPAERVVGVLDVVLAERDRDPHRGQLADRQVQRPGVRVADEAEAGPLRQPGEPLQRRARVQADGARVVGDAAADQAVLEHRGGQHLGGVQRGVPGVVDQHRHPAVVGRGEGAHPAYVLAGLGVGVLDPRDPADDVGAEVDRLADQLLGTGVAEQPVLGERDDLEVDDTAELLAQRQQWDHPLQPRLGVDVGEREHMAYAVPQRRQHGPAGVRPGSSAGRSRP